MPTPDHLLRTFVHVARAGSLRAATDALGIGQAALSKQVATLERAIGTPLFERHGRGMTLTSTGQRLFVQASQGLDLLDSAFDDACSALRVANGQVSICTINTLAAYLVPWLGPWVRSHHPQLVLSISNASSPKVVERVERGAADIGLVYDVAVDTDGVESIPLCEEVQAVYCQAGLYEDVRCFALADLARLPLVLPPRPYALRRMVESQVAGPVKVAAESNSINVGLDLAAAGVGAAVLPAALPDHIVLPRGLRRVPIEDDALSRRICAIHRRTATLQREAVQVVLQAIVALQHPPEGQERAMPRDSA